MKKSNLYNQLNIILIVVFMTLVMGITNAWLGYGFGVDWFLKFFKSWMVSLPIAYLSILIISPLTKRLTEYLCSKLLSQT